MPISRLQSELARFRHVDILINPIEMFLERFTEKKFVKFTLFNIGHFLKIVQGKNNIFKKYAGTIA